MKSFRVGGFVLFLIFALAGCGGAAAPVASIPLPSNDVSGISISQQVSLVSAQSSLTSSALSAFAIKDPVAQFLVPTSGDFVNDPVDYFVFDESMEPLELINTVLCRVDQMGYDEQVNEGNYIALVDTVPCERNQDRSSESSNQSSGQQQSFETWVVNSSRQDNNSPQIIQFWLDEFNPPERENNGGDGGDNEDEGPNFDSLKAEMVITEGVSTTNSFGLFTLNMVGYDANGNEVMLFVLQSRLNEDNEVLLEMVNTEVGDDEREEVQAIIDPNTDTGRALTRSGSFESGVFQGESALVNFDGDYYRSKIADDVDLKFEKDQCADRNQFTTNVYEYNLYDSQGSRVNRDTGFPVKINDNVWGFADYYGVWFPPEEVTALDGLTVTNDEDQNFTVRQGKGRLIKRERSFITLGDIVGQTFRSFDFDEGTEYEVQWNGTHFIRTATISFVNNRQQSTPLDPVEIMTFGTEDHLNLFKEGFGNIDVFITGTLTDSTQVPQYIESTVDMNDFSEEVTLYCYFDCLKGTLSVTDLNSNDPFVADRFMAGDAAHQYDFDPTTYSLNKDSQSVEVAFGGSVNSDSFYNWGVRSGPMVTSPLSQPGTVFNQDIVYQWETGPNEWNRYITLLNSDSEPVDFERPITCDYSDSEFGDFRLEYFGPGRLWGIPFKEIADEESAFSHWVAQFSISDGSELSCEGQTYYSKAIIAEQFMEQVDITNCSHLPLPTDLTGTTVEFEDPGLGDTPVVTSDPAVVSGVVQ